MADGPMSDQEIPITQAPGVARFVGRIAVSPSRVAARAPAVDKAVAPAAASAPTITPRRVCNS